MWCAALRTQAANPDIQERQAGGGRGGVLGILGIVRNGPRVQVRLLLLLLLSLSSICANGVAPPGLCINYGGATLDSSVTLEAAEFFWQLSHVTKVLFGVV